MFVTFARVVRPLLLRLAGAEVLPLIPLPVRAGFPYKKRSGRREYVRVRLVRNADGAVEAFKHAQDGAGVITSLTETDGLIELPEDVTTVAPGDDRRVPLLRRAGGVNRSDPHAGGRREGGLDRLLHVVRAPRPRRAAITTTAST